MYSAHTHTLLSRFPSSIKERPTNPTGSGNTIGAATNTLGKGVGTVTDAAGNVVTATGKGVGDTVTGVTQGLGDTTKGEWTS